jgi:hypothetical protein
MKAHRLLALAVMSLVAIAAVPASTGTDTHGCGVTLTTDANFKRLDRVQSAGAAKICAMYLNTIDARLTR